MRKHSRILAGVAAGIATLSGFAAFKASADGSEARAASIIHIMNGLTKPSMGKISAASSTAPASDKEWRDVETAAAMLNETSYILLEGGRAKEEAWTKACADLRAASAEALAAAVAKNADGVKASKPKIGASCKACHDVYQKQ